MRLFVAADVEPDAQEALARTEALVREALGRDASSYRFVRAEQLHLTVVFLGTTTPRQAASFVDALTPSFAEPAFRLLFTHLGAFPPMGRPKVVFARPDRSGDVPIRALRTEVIRRLVRAAIDHPSPALPTDDGGFHPHVTLARARRGHGRASDRQVVESIALRVSVRIASVTLFESSLRPDGPPRYRALARAELS